MNNILPMHNSPRCSATSKRTRLRCQAPALTGWAVCRFHGARGGAPAGKRNGAYRHGLHTSEGIEVRRAVRELMQLARAEVAALPGE
jgi:hypothetical protein